MLRPPDLPRRHAPSWYADTAGPMPVCPPLEGEARADVCVIGGGYTGLSAALHLAMRGMSVRLLEAAVLGYGASGRNGGQVGSGWQWGQGQLERRMGATDARALWYLAEGAKARIRTLIARHRIACDWREGVATAARTRRAAAEAAAEADRLARDYGYARLQPLDRAGIAWHTGSEAFAGGVIDWGAGHLHPLRYALGLARAATAAGATLHEQSPARIAGQGPPWRVVTDAGRVRADHVVVACNGYLGPLEPHTAARVLPINNFLVATEPLGARGSHILPRGIACADTRFVVNYWRRSADGRLLFGGGETYGERFPRDIAARVMPGLRAIYPDLAGVAITHAWGGTLGITRTRLPLFARPAPGLWSAAGYSGHGIAAATLAGEIVAEAVAGEAGRFELMARLPTPAFPGGRRLRHPLLALAMAWFALRDRLGL